MICSLLAHFYTVLIVVNRKKKNFNTYPVEFSASFSNPKSYIFQPVPSPPHKTFISIVYQLL